ncbi:hypothetical protein PHMEG_00016877, partial [Phytophthora megakarya]
FFTVSPDCSSSYRIANLAGMIPNDVFLSMENDFKECMIYSRAQLGQIATSNPYISARYFDHLMRIFIEVVLSWDLDKNCARPDPGLFGYTKGFFSATESQNSTGSLHAHMLIWIQKMPSTVEEYYRMCSSERFREAMIKYVDAIATSSVHLDMSGCPYCGQCSIVPLELTRESFRKSRFGASRCSTTTCQQRKKTFGADELITEHIRKTAAAIDVPVCERDDVFHLIAKSRPLSRVCSSTSAEAIAIARALVTYQHHHWFHSKSCFKVTKRTPKGNVCRMGPMVCLHLLKGSVMYSSHTSVNLPLTMILRVLFQSQEQIDVLLEEDSSGNIYKPSSIWFDYIFRPSTLETTCLMGFVAKWERRKSVRGKRFMTDHALYASHTLFKRLAVRIVTVRHKRLPDIRRVDLGQDEQLRYKQSLLALFKPFRTGSAFSADGIPFSMYFQHWWESEAPIEAR